MDINKTELIQTNVEQIILLCCITIKRVSHITSFNPDCSRHILETMGANFCRDSFTGLENESLAVLLSERMLYYNVINPEVS